MKKLFLIVASLGMFASAYSQNGEEFAKRKAEMIANIDKRIVHMQEHRACVAAANDHAALAKCHEIAKAEHEEMKGERQKSEMEHLDKKSKKLEEQKAKLMEKMKK